MSFDTAPNNIFRNNTVSNNTHAGISMAGLGQSNNLIENNTVSKNGNYGINIAATTRNSVIRFNTISECSTGIRIGEHSAAHANYGNRIYNNDFIGNTIQAVDNSPEADYWDNGLSQGGNYWSTWTTPDANGDGFVDLPFQVPGGYGRDDFPYARSQGWLPTILTTVLKNGVMGQSYLDTLAATGGIRPFVWLVSAGTLPPGLNLSSPSGTITGIPSLLGQWQFTVTLRDSLSRTTSKQFSLTIGSAGWFQTNGPNGGIINTMVVSGNNLHAGTNRGVFLSTNSGTSWTALNTGLPITSVRALAVSTGNLFAGTDLGVFRSTNNGQSWNEINTGLSNTLVRSLILSGTNLFAGTAGGSIFLSTNNGASWTPANTGLTNMTVRALVASGNNLLAGTWDRGIFLSTNNGTSWTRVVTGLTSQDVRALTMLGTNLFAGTAGGVFLSTNNGASWSAVNVGMTNLSVTAFAVIGSNIFAGTEDGVFYSTNNGSSWTAVNTGLTNRHVRAFAVSGSNLWAGTYSGVFLSSNNGTTWFAVNAGLTSTFVRALAAGGSNLFAGTFDGGVFLSTNNGSLWSNVNTGLRPTRIHSLAISGENLFAGTYREGVWCRPLAGIVTYVEERSGAEPPRDFSLFQNFPNPFNPTTTIRFELPERAFVSLKIYDILGREVETLIHRELGTGRYDVIWNARSHPSGVYCYTLNAGDRVETRRLVLLK